MGLLAALVPLGLLGAAPPPAPVVAPQGQPDPDDRPLLRVPPLIFGHPSTFHILGEGRFGTWSLIGSTLGHTPCTTARGSRCLDLAVAQLGIAWRPFGSSVSLVSAVGIASGTALPGPSQPVGFRFTAGIQIDLPPLLSLRTLSARRRVR